MKRSVRVPAAISGVALAAALLTGCATTGTTPGQSFRTAFLPPAPKRSVATEALSEPPKLEANPFLKRAPAVSILAEVLPKPTETDFRLKSSEDRFEAGRKAYQEARYDDARREFNRAIDILLATPESAPDRWRVERRLESLVDSVFKYDVNGLGAAQSEEQVAYEKSPLTGLLELNLTTDPKIRNKVLAELAATRSQLPLDVTDEVLSYVNYLTSERGKWTMIAGLKRAGRYRAMIERELTEEGLPLELIHLAQAESGFAPRAVSWAAAVGMWQFVQFRGREYGLMQSPYHDDRLDPEKATRAAARHLKDLYHALGDWNLALAAYNCGPECVNRAVQRTGYADFWKLRELRVLPRETMNYVPLILAMAIIAKNPADYGIQAVPDAALEYESLAMDAPTSLQLLADAADRPLIEIRELNPALTGTVAPPGYTARLPQGSRAAVEAALLEVPAAQRISARIHRVERGETMAMIAARYRTSAPVLAAANQGSTALAPGDLVVIPTAAPAVAARRTAPARWTPPVQTARTAQRVPVSARKTPAKPLVVRKASARIASRASY